MTELWRGSRVALAAALWLGGPIVCVPLAAQPAPRPIRSAVTSQRIDRSTAPFYPNRSALVEVSPAGLWVSGILQTPTNCDGVVARVTAQGDEVDLTLEVKTPSGPCAPEGQGTIGYRACLSEAALTYSTLTVTLSIPDGGPHAPRTVLREASRRIESVDLKRGAVHELPFMPIGPCGGEGTSIPGERGP